LHTSPVPCLRQSKESEMGLVTFLSFSTFPDCRTMQGSPCKALDLDDLSRLNATHEPGFDTRVPARLRTDVGVQSVRTVFERVDEDPRIVFVLTDE